MVTVGIVGAGLVGLAVARQLAVSGVPVIVWEKEPGVARHQSSHNSGVAHAGIYYLPGSAKAKNCRRGVELLRPYCAEHGLPWDERGKLVVARDEVETQRLREIDVADIDLAAFILVTTVEALTHSAVLYRPDILADENVGGFVNEVTGLALRYLRAGSQ